MAVVIREATREDAETIARFAMLLSERHLEYDVDRFISLNDAEGAKWYYGSQTEADNAVILLAEEEGRAIGFGFIQFEAVNYADLLKSAAWLHDIYIEESARGSGTGKKLIEASVAAAKRLGADKLMLHVAAKNAFGAEFFERNGFRTTMLEMMLKLPD